MDASDRRVARASAPSARGGVGGFVAAAVLLACMLSGCGSQQTVTPGPPTSPVSTHVAPTASPAHAHADTLRFGFVPGVHVAPGMTAPSDFRQATGGITIAQVTLSTLVSGTLYRFDARYGVVPDLADGPCQPQGDGSIVRCHLVATTFHDGSPLTADDVAYTYGVWLRPTFIAPGALGKLSEVRAVDTRTVDFVLTGLDPTLFTAALPAVYIVPRHALETSFAAFVTGTRNLDSADLAKLADTIADEATRDPPVCSPRVEALAALLAKIGVTLYREDYLTATNAFDACAYVQAASGVIRQTGIALGLSGLDAVAAAWQLLSFDWHPVGTGPYRLTSEDATGVHLEAWPGYHGGVAATRFVDLVPMTADGSGLLDGSVDVLQFADLALASRAAAASTEVRVVTLPDVGFYGLTFNVRAGRLFADLDLRRALQLCIDLPRDVDTAIGGSASPVYGPVLPGSWADDPALPRPARDTTAARKLIEDAGWQPRADGIYAKDGIRLRADIVVRANRAERVKMADLIALQARDCGMDLHSRPTSWDDILGQLFQYPHNLPGTNTPFDLYLGGWATFPDPAVALSQFASASITDERHADATVFSNLMGFSDPAFDRLLKAASSTYDMAERGRISREAQQELAAQLPMLFLWASTSTDLVRSAVATADGPLDLGVPHWAWQPERLVVEEPEP